MSKNRYIHGTVPIPGFTPIVDASADSVGVYQSKISGNSVDMGFYDNPENSNRIPNWMGKSMAIMVWIAAIGWVVNWLWESIFH